MIKNQIKSQLLSNKYHGPYYHTFVEQTVVGAASAYQVLQAWQRHEFTDSYTPSLSTVFSHLRSKSTFISVTHFTLSATKATICLGIKKSILSAVSVPF